MKTLNAIIIYKDELGNQKCEALFNYKDSKEIVKQILLFGIIAIIKKWQPILIAKPKVKK